jgi:hypothetical protein
MARDVLRMEAFALDIVASRPPKTIASAPRSPR